MATRRLDDALFTVAQLRTLLDAAASDADAAYVLCYLAIRLFEASMEHTKAEGDELLVVRELAAAQELFQAAAARSPLQPGPRATAAVVDGLMRKVQARAAQG